MMNSSAAALDLMTTWVVFLGRESLCAAIVFSVVGTAAYLTRRRGPALQLALWSLVFVRLILPPGVTHPLSVGALVGRLTETPLRVAGNDRAAGEVFTGSVDPGSMSAEAMTTAAPTPWAAWLAVVWLIGAVSTFGLYRRRRAVFQRIAGTAKHLRKPETLELADTWRRRFRVRRAVRLVSSEASIAPFTLGVIRPVIFLPRAVVEDPRSLEPVLAHEMAHVARMDALWLSLQHILQAVYFFHPLVWISATKLNQERERLCDATVVSAGRLAARDYVGGLLNVLRLDLQGVGAPTMTARKRRIGVRIQDIIDRDGGARPRLAPAIAVTIFLGVFLLPMATGDADAIPAPDNPPEKGASEARVVEVDLQIANPLPGGRVTRSWGPGHLDPFTKKEVFHRGIDVASSLGTEVLAAAGGVVTVATESYEETPGSGTVIIVDHGNGLSTYYGHLETLEVNQGQTVAQSEVIATVGSTGKSTGPHLHFEVKKNGSTEDPALFVTEWQ